MTTIHTRVLRALRGSIGATPYGLSLVLGRPEPSIRRVVGELRGRGWPIETVCGFYVLAKWEALGCDRGDGVFQFIKRGQ